MSDGSQIFPSAPEFFGLGPRGGELAWDKEGEVWYNFLDPAEEGSSTEAGPSEKAEECVAKLNDYLTARGYGREAAFRIEKTVVQILSGTKTPVR